MIGKTSAQPHLLRAPQRPRSRGSWRCRFRKRRRARVCRGGAPPSRASVFAPAGADCASPLRNARRPCPTRSAGRAAEPSAPCNSDLFAVVCPSSPARARERQNRGSIAGRCRQSRGKCSPAPAVYGDDIADFLVSRQDAFVETEFAPGIEVGRDLDFESLESDPAAGRPGRDSDDQTACQRAAAKYPGRRCPFGAAGLDRHVGAQRPGAVVDLAK